MSVRQAHPSPDEGVEPAELRNTIPAARSALFHGYVAAVVTLAGVAFAASVLAGTPPVPADAAPFWLMGGLAVLCDVRPFTPSGRRLTAALFPSVSFTFAILLLWGLAPAVLVQTVGVLVVTVRLRHALWRGAFNAGQYALSFAAAAAVLGVATATDPFGGGRDATGADVPALLLAAAAWFAVNHVLVTTAVWLRFRGRWRDVLVRALGYEALSTSALLLLGPVLATLANHSAWLVPLILVPLYAVSRMAWLTSHQARLARLDPLTGLANRTALESAVRWQIRAHRDRAVSGDPACRFALLLLDLDRFKTVNDALGHQVGDRLLTEVARRLADNAQPGDLVTRLGGDEFAILTTHLRDSDEAVTRAERIAAALATPVLLDGLPLDVDGAIGVAVHPLHGADFATLMQHADVAMYDAKNRGDQVAVYAPESDHNTPERLSLLADLRRALEDPGTGEINLYYQPQVAIGSGEVVGAEALLRWHHPDRGMVDPEELIRVAEHSAVMRLLTLRVIDEVLTQLARWGDSAGKLRAAINVSVRDLHTSDIADHLAERLAAHRLSPGRVQLEITEGALMADPHRVLATLSRLDRLGVAIALDDFGTGYSSMQHLRRLPLAEVKIDRSFVLGMADDEDDAAIVRSMIEMATALGLRVVAEGVEDERTWRLLADAGCHVAQGWFYARPMPAGELIDWLGRYRPPQPNWTTTAATIAGTQSSGASRPGGRTRRRTDADLPQHLAGSGADRCEPAETAPAGPGTTPDEPANPGK